MYIYIEGTRMPERVRRYTTSSAWRIGFPIAVLSARSAFRLTSSNRQSNLQRTRTRTNLFGKRKRSKKIRRHGGHGEVCGEILFWEGSTLGSPLTRTFARRRKKIGERARALIRRVCRESGPPARSGHL